MVEHFWWAEKHGGRRLVDGTNGGHGGKPYDENTAWDEWRYAEKQWCVVMWVLTRLGLPLLPTILHLFAASPPLQPSCLSMRFLSVRASLWCYSYHIVAPCAVATITHGAHSSSFPLPLVAVALVVRVDDVDRASLVIARSLPRSRYMGAPHRWPSRLCLSM